MVLTSGEEEPQAGGVDGYKVFNVNRSLPGRRGRGSTISGLHGKILTTQSGENKTQKSSV